MVSKAVGYVLDLFEQEETTPVAIPDGFTGVTIPKYAMEALKVASEQP